MENLVEREVSQVVELENGYVQIIFSDGSFIIVKMVASSEDLVLTGAPDAEEEEEGEGEGDDEDEEGDDEDEEEEGDDEEEEGDEYTKEEINEADFEELEEIIDEEELEIDIEDYEDNAKSLKKLKKAVIKALEL